MSDTEDKGISIPMIDATRRIRDATGAPLEKVRDTLRQSKCDIDASMDLLEREAISTIQARARCERQTAVEAYGRFGWDIEAAARWIRELAASGARAEEVRIHCQGVIEGGRVADYTVLGQRDAYSTEPEEVVYYVAGLFERFRTNSLFSFDCDDLNTGAVGSLRALGMESLGDRISDLLALDKNDAAQHAETTITQEDEEQVLSSLRGFVNANRNQFRVLKQ